MGLKKLKIDHSYTYIHIQVQKTRKYKLNSMALSEHQNKIRKLISSLASYCKILTRDTIETPDSLKICLKIIRDSSDPLKKLKESRFCSRTREKFIKDTNSGKIKESQIN